MTIDHPKFGRCDLTIIHGRISSVDSFIESAYSETLDRELTDTELDLLQDEYSAEVQEYSYSGGFSRNHN